MNTCAFIDSAKQESIDTILEMAQHKKDGACRRLIVTGCLPERYRDELKAQIPEIDAVLGTGEVPEIVGAIGGRLRAEGFGEQAARGALRFRRARRPARRPGTSTQHSAPSTRAFRPTSTTRRRRGCSRRRGTTPT